MRKHKVFLLGMALFCTLCIMACTSSTSNVGIGEFVPAPGGDYAFTNSIVINNPGLSRHIQIVDIKGMRESDVMKAEVVVINKYDKDYNFEYKFQWYDSKNFEIRSVQEHWVPVLIYGQETKNLVGIAPAPEATKFRINLRAAHPVR